MSDQGKMIFSSAQNPRSWYPNADIDGDVITFITDADAKKAEVLFNTLQNELAEKEAALAALLNAEHCPHCGNQGVIVIQTGGCYSDGENDTRDLDQGQCDWCYMTPNSFFNIRASLPESAKQDAEILRLAGEVERVESLSETDSIDVIDALCKAVRARDGK